MLGHDRDPARRATRPTIWRFRKCTGWLRRVVYSSFGVGVGIGFSAFSGSRSLSCLLCVLSFYWYSWFFVSMDLKRVDVTGDVPAFGRFMSA